MPTCLREATRSARKTHRCGSCNGVITVGQRHHVSTNLWNGRVYDWRTCEACQEDRIVEEVYYWAGSPDEGVGYESAWEWAHEFSTETGAVGDAARRWLVRSGCACERCEAPKGGGSDG